MVRPKGSFPALSSLVTWSIKVTAIGNENWYPCRLISFEKRVAKRPTSREGKSSGWLPGRMGGFVVRNSSTH